jgi:hypothetical protein
MILYSRCSRPIAIRAAMALLRPSAEMPAMVCGLCGVLMTSRLILCVRALSLPGAFVSASTRLGAL